jgi:para-aminobenzoate synthetase
VRTLLIDNRDSYTFNLFQLIADVNGNEPAVVVNDDPMLTALPAGAFDNVVISPGPGHPGRSRDTGHVPGLLADCDLPVLGVCLGHQAIALAAGARVGPAPRPRHGHLSTIVHSGDDPLFEGIPAEFTAVRYHSLCVAEPVPDSLVVTARAEDGVIMAVRHKNRPRWGVQFHPESIASEHGRRLLENFRDLTGPRSRCAKGALERKPSDLAAFSPELPIPVRLISREVPVLPDAEAVFAEFFAASDACFWLDGNGLSRFSFLGTGRHTLVHQAGEGGFAALAAELRRFRIGKTDLPFGFAGGYVGYFGYEMKAECGADQAHVAATPDSAWMLADRFIAIDHEEKRAYVAALGDGAWVEHTASLIGKLTAPLEPPAEHGEPASPEPFLTRDRDGYLADVAECQRQLVAGESYEITLSNRLYLPFAGDDFEFYRRLRRTNPAPYSAFLRIAGVAVFSSSPERFLRIGPDRRVESKPIKGTAPRHRDPDTDSRLASDLASSAKNRAENLMIVDLLRNDLGQVCEVGSVTVDRYMAVESYATVHHLVSTISGTLRPEVSAVECVRRCFPGGSMTGAPKLRTMEIIDRLETEARGVYSGALGYFSLSGPADLSIVIRTAVRHGDTLTIGAGGAVVLDSTPAEEYQEMLLKASAPLPAYRR